jgi:hypothetical protein
MRRVLLWVGGLTVLVIAAVVGLVVWQLQPRPRPEPVPVTFETLDPGDPPAAITIRGTAHYRGVVRQRVPPSLAGGAREYHVYGLFPLYDTEGREIRLLVRDPEPPPPRIDLEFVELTGWLDRPRPHTIPFRTEELLARSDYFFSDEVLVLEPWARRTLDPADAPAGASLDPFERAMQERRARRADTDASEGEGSDTDGAAPE